MIIDRLENLKDYESISEKVGIGLRYLRDSKFDELSDGKQSIDGNRTANSSPPIR